MLGENPESKLLESSIWSDLNVRSLKWSARCHLMVKKIFSVLIVTCCVQVAESLTKYCILLHILEGSSDATNFSAICILLLNSNFKMSFLCLSWHYDIVYTTHWSRRSWVFFWKMVLAELDKNEWKGSLKCLCAFSFQSSNVEDSYWSENLAKDCPHEHVTCIFVVMCLWRLVHVTCLANLVFITL